MDNLARKLEPALWREPAYPLPAEKIGPRYTYADYLLWDDNIRREIIGGEVYDMAAPSMDHQGISTELVLQFGTFLRGKPCRVYAAPVDVRLFAKPETADTDKSDRDVVQPDLIVVCDRRKRQSRACCGAPEFVLEILSPSNRSHDDAVRDSAHGISSNRQTAPCGPYTLLKFNKYLAAGVKEYWVVDPENRTITVHTLVASPGGNFYRTDVYGEDAHVPVGVIDGLVIDAAAVFAAADPPAADDEPYFSAA